MKRSGSGPFGIPCWIPALTLMAACGGGGEDAQPGQDAPPEPAIATGSFDACALFTAEELEAALGWKPTTSEPYPGANGTGHCVYEGAADLTATGVPQKFDTGIGVCPTNMPCVELPDFASSEELAAYRRELYEGSSSAGLATIEPIEGLGVPAILHDLAGLVAIEMAIGRKKLAYVETWASPGIARALAEKLVARVR